MNSAHVPQKAQSYYSIQIVDGGRDVTREEPHPFDTTWSIDQWTADLEHNQKVKIIHSNRMRQNTTKKQRLTIHLGQRFQFRFIDEKIE